MGAGYTPLSSHKLPAAPVGKNYETLGGWLLFFVIGYGLSAVLSLRDLLNLLHICNVVGAPLRGVVQFMGCSILNCVLCIAADALVIMIIVRRRPDFLRLFQIISIARAGACIILSVVGTLIATIPGSSFVGETIATVRRVTGCRRQTRPHDPVLL